MSGSGSVFSTGGDGGNSNTSNQFATQNHCSYSSSSFGASPANAVSSRLIETNHGSSSMSMSSGSGSGSIMETPTTTTTTTTTSITNNSNSNITSSVKGTGGTKCVSFSGQVGNNQAPVNLSGVNNTQLTPPTSNTSNYSNDNNAYTKSTTSTTINVSNTVTRSVSDDLFKNAMSNTNTGADADVDFMNVPDIADGKKSNFPPTKSDNGYNNSDEHIDLPIATIFKKNKVDTTANNSSISTSSTGIHYQSNACGHNASSDTNTDSNSNSNTDEITKQIEQLNINSSTSSSGGGGMIFSTEAVKIYKT